MTNITTPTTAVKIDELTSTQIELIRKSIGLFDFPFQTDKTYIIFDAESGDNELEFDAGDTSSYTILAGDGSAVVSYSDAGGTKTINYESAGRYLITIDGDFQGINTESDTQANKDKIIGVIAGSNYPVTIPSSAFELCSNLQSFISTGDTITTISDSSFSECESLNYFDCKSAVSDSTSFTDSDNILAKLVNGEIVTSNLHEHSPSDINETTLKSFVSDTEKLGFWSGSSTVLYTSKNVCIGGHSDTSYFLDVKAGNSSTFAFFGAEYDSKKHGLYFSADPDTQNVVLKSSGTTAGGFIFMSGSISRVEFAANGDVTATRFIKNGGTASQFLKADGSIDESTYLTEESDTLDSVTARGAETSHNITMGDITVGIISAGDTYVDELTIVDDGDLNANNITAEDITADKIYASEGRKIAGSLHASTNSNEIYDALVAVIPTTGDKIIISGGISGSVGVYIMSYAEKLSTSIKIYGILTGGSFGSVEVSDGGTTIYQCSIAW